MKYFRYILACACAAFGCGTANATDACEVNRAADALACAIKHHPAVVQSAANALFASANKGISSRWLSPESEGGVEYTRAEAEGVGVVLDIALMQDIETPAKRGARKSRAEAEYAYADAETEGQKEQAAVQMLTVLNRLRQIDKEKRALDEAINAFNGVIKKYGARPVLSPEDQVSKDLFGFALNNYIIEKSQLDFEENKLKGNLAAILGARAVGKKLFLHPPRVWPTISDDGITASADLAKESANIIKANADYLEAKSSSFGSFRVGPYIKTKPGNIGKIDSYGVKFSFPLPIYYNSDLRNAGKMSVSSAESGFEAKKRELYANLENMKSQYSSGVSILIKYDIAGMEKNHTKAERLFVGGRVGGALLIETHRQMMDSVRAYHQYEIETLQALWEIYILQKKLLTNLDEVYDEKI